MMQPPFHNACQDNDQTYLFIDGGYVQKRYSDAVRSWFGSDGKIDFTALIHAYPAGKSFYYYCLDEEKGEGESQREYEARMEGRKALLNKVREAHGCHIRLGVIKGKNRRQKKVDILLAVDMLTHAANRNMTRALLLAGDLDFQPAIESLVQLGIFVELIADDKHTSPELTWAASSYRKLTFSDYYSWTTSELKAKYPLPRPGGISKLILKRASALKTGSLNGNKVTLYQTEEKFYLCTPSSEEEAPIYFEHDDVGRLELYLEKQGHRLSWD